VEEPFKGKLEFLSKELIGAIVSKDSVKLKEIKEEIRHISYFNEYLNALESNGLSADRYLKEYESLHK